MQSSLRVIEWADIFDIWSSNLWQGREDIRPMSSMLYLGGYDIDIYKKYNPVFIGAFVGDRLVGVNSCHPTTNVSYRSRGLWVDPAMRGYGLGGQLLDFVSNIARANGAEYIWSLPKKESASVYIRAGFEIVSDWLQSDTGINAYAIKDLRF